MGLIIGESVMTVTPAAGVYEGIRLAYLGETVNARGISAREARYPTIVVAQPWQLPFQIPGRGGNAAIGALEACSLVGQTSVPEWLSDRVGAFARFVEDGSFWGAYGPRVAGQLGLVIQAIRDDPDTRQAVVTIFDGHRDMGRSTVDVPCTIAIQFMLRSGLLEARAVMRSNDAWLGLTYDVVQFIALQAAVAKALDVPMGPYAHQPGSLHLYEEHADLAGRIERPTEELSAYDPLWSGEDIGQISRWCRDAAQGKRPKPGTSFEEWIVSAIR